MSTSKDSNEETSQLSSKAPIGQGQMIDVGGHRLYFRFSGQGNPAVIMESGLGGSTGAFFWLEQELRKFTTVCVYDRAGLGRSEAGSKPFDFLETVPQLHTLLEKAGVKGPYILAGHSIGGILIRGFTEKYPDEVAGLVFLDSSHPEQMERAPKSMVRQSKMLLNILKFLVGEVPLKAGRFKDAKYLPTEIQAELKVDFNSARHFRAMRAEYEGLDILMAKTRAFGKVGARPVAVFSASLPKTSFMPLWHQLQAEIAALSTNSTHQILSGARHISLITDRENALVIVAQVRKMVEEIRAGTSTVPQE